VLADLKIPNKIQLEEYSTGSAADGTTHKTTGQLWYLILNRNADKRNLNVNRYNLDNNWSEGYRFLVVRK
jgi:hypothetical protein